MVDGYGILSMESPVTSLCPSLKLSYTMATLDQGGSLHSVYTLAKRNMRILFIGKDLISTIIYIAAIRKAVGKHCHVTALLDEESVDKLDPTQVIAELNQWADAAYIIDVTQPISSGEFLI
ncbi:MAG: hypothetical protein RR661_05790, partial [Anaerovoracaceae bacterium]